MITVVRSKKTGLPVTTKEAYLQRGDGYECLVCGADQVIRPSRLGNLHAACRGNVEHAQGCPCLTLVGTNDFIEIGDIDLCAMAADILSPSEEGHGEKFWGPGAPHPNAERIFAPRKLKHLYQLGLCTEEDFKINDHVSLSDILYNQKTAQNIDTTRAMGYRAIFAAPRWYDRREKTIYFRAFPEKKSKGSYPNYSDLFGLEYLDDDEFESDINRLFSFGYARYKNVLIFGDWFLLDKYVAKPKIERYQNTSRPLRGIQVASCWYPQKQIYVNNAMLTK